VESGTPAVFAQLQAEIFPGSACRCGLFKAMNTVPEGLLVPPSAYSYWRIFAGVLRARLQPVSVAGDRPDHDLASSQRARGNSCNFDGSGGGAAPDRGSHGVFVRRSLGQKQGGQSLVFKCFLLLI
jgi:hypothetical protein